MIIILLPVIRLGQWLIICGKTRLMSVKYGFANLVLNDLTSSDRPHFRACNYTGRFALLEFNEVLFFT
jgi:hypothetical protein